MKQWRAWLIPMLIPIGILITFGGLTLIVDSDLKIARRDTEMIVGMVGLVLWGIGLWQLRAVRLVMYPVAWRYSLTLGNYPIFLAAVAGVIAVQVLDTPIAPRDGIGYLLPLLTGLQAAFVFSPDDEPMLETGLSLPRPALWTFGERLGVLMVGFGLIALVLGVATGNWAGIIGWILPAIFFAGFGAYITLRTRVAMFGAVVVAILWGMSLYMRDFTDGLAFPPPLNLVTPFLWAVLPFADGVLLNRLLLAGLALHLLIQVGRLLSDEEFLLLGDH